MKNVNEILRASFDFCQPSVMVETETVNCIDSKGRENHILLIRIPQSSELHANHRDKDEIFEGRILDLVEGTIGFVRGQIREHT